jgi:coenzyme F420-dependent glucose-6-phosphate dehydrogenase
MSVRIGYKASAEQFGPRKLLEFSLAAEEKGFDIVAVSDHFQPWRHNGGHAPAAMPWLAALGQASRRAALGTSVLTPTLRYHPSIVAQAFGTLASLSPGRIFLGIGSGEAMNETPATGQEFPGRKERRLRLAEAIELIRRLWDEERVDFKGDYYEVSKATIYDRPDVPPPIFVAASGPLAAKLAGRVGDGFICTSGKDPELYRNLLDNLSAGAKQVDRDPTQIRRMIEVKVSYDRDPDRALDSCKWWAALALSPEQKEGIEDPIEMERVADENADRAHTRFIVSSDPEEVVEKIGGYLDLGFDDLVLHAPGGDQSRFLEQFAEDVAPALRARAELPRLRYLTETLAWMGGDAAWSAEMVAEQVGDYDGQVTRPDLVAAERAGLVQRDQHGLRLSELGWSVAAGVGEAVRTKTVADQGRVIADVVPELCDGVDPVSLQNVAQIIAWIGGDRAVRAEFVAEELGGIGHPRIMRELAAAEKAGIIQRVEHGGIRLTDRGWDVAAADA